MSFTDELKAKYNERQRMLELEQRKAEQQRIDKATHLACLDYIEKMLKESFTSYAKDGCLRNGVNKGFFVIGDSNSPYHISFALCSDEELKKKKTKDYLFSYYHGPQHKKVIWLPDPRRDYDECSSDCSSNEIVAILNGLGFNNATHELISHKYSFRRLGTKYKDTEEAYFYSFNY